MSFTHFNSMTAYKSMDSDVHDVLYVVIANTADSSIRPLNYHNWPIATGRLYEVMGTACKMASDAFNGNLHWHGTWGEIGISSKFLAYAENVLKQAKETEEPIPNIPEYPVFTFGEDEPGSEILKRFAGLDRFTMRNFWDKKQIVIHNPCVKDIYWAKQLNEHYSICKKYAAKAGEIDPVLLRKYLGEWCNLYPEPYRKLLQGAEK